ncbi:SDR family NAD(P)-dependent oxidoreductase [Reichenbachiella agarivorans]|uniref:SDR family NAD(P)-dependent oxidoreductase n=1 Tax=Reichenbachiella agarivorans TaxID=2979464 RepID=A0ABY6CPS4_9BACT|nr:SDR family NAD(P)-dependent oxidoreductase [Reichenbachiella agarivorans]UXP32521.1 SDR family NAD(P)-dependent oxidoreductase [Reichenbachiella agarivorans]
MIALKNKWILVTGASSGLGLEMAKLLASKHQANLILVARRADRLAALKTEILATSDIQIETLVADLSQEAETTKVINLCLSMPEFGGAILNAGMTYLGEHARITDEKISQILQLNVISTTTLATHFVRHFEQNGNQGNLMVISSLAAHYPTPYQALYSGTKGYLTNFLNSIALEVRNPRLKLSVFSPGGIVTEMTADDNFKTLQRWLMPVHLATREAIHCFVSGKHNYVPGISNRIAFAFMKVLPLRLITVILGKQYRKALRL